METEPHEAYRVMYDWFHRLFSNTAPVEGSQRGRVASTKADTENFEGKCILDREVLRLCMPHGLTIID